MATVNLGRVSFVLKGDWDNTATYKRLDVVYGGSSSYVAKTNVPAGTALTNTTYWQLLSGSSYDIAVENGFTGTETEWVELVASLDSRVTELDGALD